MGSLSSLSSVEPVESMVSILVPAPGVVVHTLVPIVDDKLANINNECIPPILHNPNPLQVALADMDHLVNMSEEEALQVLEDGLSTENTEIHQAVANPSPPYYERVRDDLMAGPSRVDRVSEFWAFDDD